MLVSFVPRNTWTTEALPPVLASELRGARRDAGAAAPDRQLAVDGLRRDGGAVLLGFAAAYAAVRRRAASGPRSRRSSPRRGRCRDRVRDRPRRGVLGEPAVGGAVRARRHGRDPAARLPRAVAPLTGRAAAAGLRQMDPALEEAAASLGASRAAVPPRRRAAPAPGARRGASLAFLAAVGDFVVSIVLYTYETRPISIEICPRSASRRSASRRRTECC
jgi:iron(III) transport system permease protein